MYLEFFNITLAKGNELPKFMHNSDIISLDQYLINNQLLTTRSAHLPFDVSRTSPKIKFKAKLNGKHVNSYIYSSYECLGLRVSEKAYKP